jgi:hypothetical protein
MRKVLGLFLASALVLPLAVMVSPAGSAAAKPTCKTLSGTATFSPALSNTAAKSKPTVTIKGAKLAGCTGGGVTGGTVGTVLKFGVASNCASLIKGDSTKTSGTTTVVWNTKATSVAKVTLVGVPKKPTSQTVAGTISTGLFKGSKLSVVTIFTIPKGGCTTAPLSKVTFKQVSALTVK